MKNIEEDKDRIKNIIKYIIYKKNKRIWLI
jgi:hypothetical protein